MNIQPIRLEVHRLHAVRLEHAVLLGQVSFGKCLVVSRRSAFHPYPWGPAWGTNSLIMLFANLLACKLAHPVVAAGGGAVFGHEAWDDEGHGCGAGSAFGEGAEYVCGVWL